MTLQLFPTLVLGKTVGVISRLLGYGTGTAWSGKIGLSLNPALICILSSHLDERIVVVGTNGKTTTTAMIAHILEGNDRGVVHNVTGANLKNGIAGSLIHRTSIAGHFDVSIGLFEIDEAEFVQVIEDIKPTIVVLLNLFRDQLDRYGEIDVIADKWKEVLQAIKHKPELVVNGDDPLIASIGMGYKGRVVYFGVGDKGYKGYKADRGNRDQWDNRGDRDQVDSTADSTYCIACGNRLSYNRTSFSHFGDWRCTSCGLKRPKLTLDAVRSPLQGAYNYYNALAAVLTGMQVGVAKKKAQDSIITFQPVFGRQEELVVQGKRLKMILSKNPVGFNESMRSVLAISPKPTVILALNDRHLDGTDVSWIWDTDVEELVATAVHIVCTGDRAWDMGLRAKYALKLKTCLAGRQAQYSILKTISVEPDLKHAIQTGLEKTKKGETLYILPTYSAMLDLRKILTGRKI